jgi:hypothetical protein
MISATGWRANASSWKSTIAACARTRRSIKRCSITSIGETDGEAMPTVFFTHLALLSGLAALAIPVLIHLLIKRKKLRLRFSTIQFFLKHDEQSSKRRKLRNWLLLAVRLLLVALLVMAFARPFTRMASTTSSQTKRVGIFVLDRSASMQATAHGESAWNRAMKLTQAALREFKTDDQAAIVTCSTRAEVFSAFKPAPAITRLLETITPEFTKGDLADGLRSALKLASTRDPNTTATIYLVSDLQKNTAQDLQTVGVPADIEVKLLNGGEIFASNVAIADLRLEGQVKPQAQIALQSFSDEDQAGLKLSFVVDGKEVVNTVVALKAGLVTNMVLALPAFKPGWHSAEARLTAEDALKADDVRYHAFFVPEPLRVLCVETKSGARIHEQDTFFVASALQPDTEPGTSVPALFRVEITDPSALVSKLGSVNGSTGYAAVILPALRQIPVNAGETLSKYVRAGGGLLLFVGDGMSANRYNAEFRDLLPLPLDSLDSRANAGWRLEGFDKTSPVFAVFVGTAAANLRLPQFSRRFRIPADSFPAGGTSILAAFDDGVPLIASRSVSAGRVMLMNTSVDASWSDWPKRKSFVPWLHGTVNYLGGRSGREAMQPNRVFTAGEDAELSLGLQWKGRSLVVERVGAKPESKIADDEGHLAGLHLGPPGSYIVRDSKGVELQRWAVNLAAGESDLAALSPEKIQKQLLRERQAPSANLQASLFGAGNGEREWWRVLLLASLCLMFAEVVLANRTRA